MAAGKKFASLHRKSNSARRIEYAIESGGAIFALASSTHQSSMALFAEFREFLSRGNAVDLAVGVIIGAAFTNVVTSITEGIIRPLIALIAPDPSAGLMLGQLDIGRVLGALVNFLLTAAVIFFIIVKPMNALRRKRERTKAKTSQ